MEYQNSGPSGTLREYKRSFGVGDTNGCENSFLLLLFSGAPNEKILAKDLKCHFYFINYAFLDFFRAS